MRSYQLVSAPQSEPITLDEAKAHLRIEYDFTDDDALIQALIKAVRQHTETITNSLFINQTWKLVLDHFPEGADPITIRRRPITDISAIEYIDSDGALQTLASFQKDLDGFVTRVMPAINENWPATREQMNAVEIRFTAGYENTEEAIPQTLKQAMLLLIGHYYENREDSITGISMQNIPMAYEALVGANRLMNV